MVCKFVDDDKWEMSMIHDTGNIREKEEREGCLRTRSGEKPFPTQRNPTSTYESRRTRRGSLRKKRVPRRTRPGTRPGPWTSTSPWWVKFKRSLMITPKTGDGPVNVYTGRNLVSKVPLKSLGGVSVVFPSSPRSQRKSKSRAPVFSVCVFVYDWRDGPGSLQTWTVEGDVDGEPGRTSSS